MPQFKFQTRVEVRYGDVDAQGHVNHAKFFTYMEQARMLYLLRVGLWDLHDFKQIGVIVAEAECDYRAPIHLGELVTVGVRVPKIGTKSLVMEYLLSDGATGRERATGRTVLVAYDYEANQSIPVPADWREKISSFESPYG